MNGFNLQYEKLWKLPERWGKSECTLHLVDSGVQHQQWGGNIQEKGNYCSKLKKEKLKNRKLFKITMLDQQQPSVQSKDRTKAVQVWSWENIYLLKRRKWLVTSENR